MSAPESESHAASSPEFGASGVEKAEHTEPSAAHVQRDEKGTHNEPCRNASAASDRSLVDELLHERKSEARALRYEAALEKIAAPKRPDGTYNLSREACEQIAKEALRDAD